MVVRAIRKPDVNQICILIEKENRQSLRNLLLRNFYSTDDGDTRDSVTANFENEPDNHLLLSVY